MSGSYSNISVQTRSELRHVIFNSWESFPYKYVPIWVFRASIQHWNNLLPNLDILRKTYFIHFTLSNHMAEMTNLPCIGLMMYVQECLAITKLKERKVFWEWIFIKGNSLMQYFCNALCYITVGKWLTLKAGVVYKSLTRYMRLAFHDVQTLLGPMPLFLGQRHWKRFPGKIQLWKESARLNWSYTTHTPVGAVNWYLESDVQSHGASSFLFSTRNSHECRIRLAEIAP